VSNVRIQRIPNETDDFRRQQKGNLLVLLGKASLVSEKQTKEWQRFHKLDGFRQQTVADTVMFRVADVKLL
jgi:DNA segregation ATPase FtsK/SpoIIIE-like protein